MLVDQADFHVAMVNGAARDEAAELFEKALTVDSAYSSAWLGLAECARYAGDRKRALKLYLRAVTLNEWNHRAWLRGADVLEELGFHDNAASWRRKVAMHFPDHPSCRNGEVSDGDREPSRLQPAG
jgi:tetratricopeptide (TPR) repeat protein